MIEPELVKRWCERKCIGLINPGNIHCHFEKDGICRETDYPSIEFFFRKTGRCYVLEIFSELPF